MRFTCMPKNANIFSLPLRGAVALVLMGAVCSLASPEEVRAQSEPTTLSLPRLAGSITLDGDISEAAWAAIAPLPMTQHQPVFGVEPTERTVIRIAYDREYLYVAAQLYDREPERIQATTLYRDALI